MADIITTAEVLTSLGLSEAHASEVAPVTAAVNSLVAKYKGDHESWPDHWKQGARMLAARIYRRRDSPAGVESMGELGPVYVQRNDPDLAQLLELGRYAPPMVG